MRKVLLFLVTFIFLFISLAFADTVKNYKGVKYYFYKVNDADIGVINIKVRAGSIFDAKGKFGTAALLAEMLKRGGTKKYSTNVLLNKLDETGIELYSGATKDFINIGIKFISNEEKNAFDILEQVLFYPTFGQREFDSLKAETVARIISYQNNNDYVAIHRGVVELIKNKEYSHSSFGEKNEIKNITINDLKDFYNKYFCNENFIVTFAGNIKENLIDTFLKKNFIDKRCKEKVDEIYPEFSNKKVKIFKEKELKQSYIYFLFPSLGLKDNRYYSLKTLSFLLGGNLTSILSEKIRKEKGLAYSVFSTNFSMVNGGFFVIGMQTENKKAKEAISTVKKILKELKEKGVPGERVGFAKKYLIGKIPVSIQSLSSIAGYYSEAIYLNKSLPPWNYDIAMYKKVTKNSVDNIIKNIFDFDKMILSVVGKSN